MKNTLSNETLSKNLTEAEKKTIRDLIDEGLKLVNTESSAEDFN